MEVEEGKYEVPFEEELTAREREYEGRGEEYVSAEEDALRRAYECAEVIKKNSDGEPRNFDHFLGRYIHLQEQHQNELEVFSSLCDEHCDRICNVLKIGTPASQKETQSMPASSPLPQLSSSVREKGPTEVMSDLKKKYGDALSALQIGYAQSKKKKRNLSKQATDILNMWFYNHLHDPYPTDEEKNILSQQCGLTLSQVNNWFGNKRMRYKRKMLEQARKNASVEPGETAQWRGTSQL